MLSDEHWSKLREILLHKTIYNKRDLRMTVEGMLYRMRTGCPWRDLPEAARRGSYWVVAALTCEGWGGAVLCRSPVPV
jgi:transposase